MRTLLNKFDILAIAACLLWSSAFVSIKIGLLYTTPLQFAGIRFLLSGLIILPLCGSLALFLKEIQQNIALFLQTTFFQTALLYILFYSGINLIPASVAAMIIGSQPLVIALIAHFFAKGDRLNRRKVMSIVLGLSGVLLIAVDRGEVSGYGWSEVMGILFLLASNVCAAIGNIMVAQATAGVSYLRLNCAQLFLGGLCILLVSIPVEGLSWQPKELPYYLSLGWLSLLSATALSIWFYLLRSGAQVSSLNIWKFLIPVSGAILSWLIIEGESPKMLQIAGMVLIVSALMLLNYRRSSQ